MPKRNLAWILVVAMIALLMWQLPQTIAGRDSVYRAFGPLVDVRTQIHRRYVVDIDDHKLVDAAVRAGVDAMVQELDDPHAVYLSRDEYEQFKRRKSGVFGGIGVDVWKTDEGLEVLSREHGSPAVEAGILPGDIIMRIDGQRVADMPLVEAVGSLLNGEPGTEVKLRVKTPQAGGKSIKRDLTLVRAIVQLDPVRGWTRGPRAEWRFVFDSDRRIAYIRLVKFTPDVDRQLDRCVHDMLRHAGLKGIILDLRENTGGLLPSAIEVADRFLDSGMIVSTRGRTKDRKEWFATHDIGYPDLALVVLVNGSTASAAEIVAGALRDHGRAEVVGERTYGKGSVQEVVELDRDNGALKLTTAYYYLPNGECIHRTPQAAKNGSWGVAPTAPVSLTPSQRQSWLQVWRMVGREIDRVEEDKRAGETEAAADARAVDDAREALLAGDIQLRKAYDLIAAQLDSPGGKRRTTDAVSSPADKDRA